MSQQLREVEAKIGMPLFVRHRRGLEATPIGEIMLRLAAAMGVDLNIAAQELALSAQSRALPIRIGSMVLTSAGLLALALGHFAAQYPNSSVVLMEGSRELLLEHLRHRRIDLFVGRLPEDDSTGDLSSETLFLDGAVVIAAARHPIGRRVRPLMEHLQPFGWILPAEDNSFYKQIAQSMRDAGQTLPSGRIRSYRRRPCRQRLALMQHAVRLHVLGILLSQHLPFLANNLSRVAVDALPCPSICGCAACLRRRFANLS